MTPQEQRSQRTEPNISQLKAQNQVKPGIRKTGLRPLCPTNQRVLAQDEVVRPHESLATPQAIRENGTIQHQADRSEPSEPRDEKNKTQVH